MMLMENFNASSSRDKSITDLKLATNMDVSFNVGKYLLKKLQKRY